MTCFDARGKRGKLRYWLVFTFGTSHRLINQSRKSRGIYRCFVYAETAAENSDAPTESKVGQPIIHWPVCPPGHEEQVPSGAYSFLSLNPADENQRAGPAESTISWGLKPTRTIWSATLQENWTSFSSPEIVGAPEEVVLGKKKMASWIDPFAFFS